MDALSETILGPLLLPALAHRGVWTLHASAIIVGENVIAFLGHSGAGKSTLARHLAGSGTGSYRLVADDVLPVTMIGEQALVLPHFPQLKLGADSHHTYSLPDRIPLEAVYNLQKPADSHSKEVTVQAIDPAKAPLVLLRHTLASRLFCERLLGQHLAFCATISQRLPVRKLVYPRKHDFLPKIEQGILADIGHRHYVSEYRIA